MKPPVGIFMATTISDRTLGCVKIYLLLLLATPLSGCDMGNLPGAKFLPFGNRSFHQKFDWQADKFFKDPQVIALCKAIEANDLAEMERLIAAGADVNARGEGNMTPLMWAFPDNQLSRFKKLLEHGADPNVKITTHLGVPSGFAIGDSVTTESAQTHFPGYFRAVMEAGGDPNIRNRWNMPLMVIVIHATVGDAQERCAIALKHGADIHARWAGATLPMQAVSASGQYDLALYFIEQGADYKAYRDDKLQRLIHALVTREAEIAQLPPEHQVGFKRLFNWLVAHGEDADAARADLARWATFSRVPGAYARQSRAEIAAREAKEKQLENQDDK